jgi:hypothetical protein
MGPGRLLPPRDRRRTRGTAATRRAAAAPDLVDRRVVDDRGAIRDLEPVARWPARAVVSIAGAEQLDLVLPDDREVAVEHHAPVRQVAPRRRVAAQGTERAAAEQPAAHRRDLDLDATAAGEVRGGRVDRTDHRRQRYSGRRHADDLEPAGFERPAAEFRT